MEELFVYKILAISLNRSKTDQFLVCLDPDDHRIQYDNGEHDHFEKGRLDKAASNVFSNVVIDHKLVDIYDIVKVNVFCLFFLDPILQRWN